MDHIASLADRAARPPRRLDFHFPCRPHSLPAPTRAWGDPVNIASRMESAGEAGKIQIAAQTRDQLTERFDLEERGVIEVKGKGPMRTWFLIGRKHVISDSSTSTP